MPSKKVPRKNISRVVSDIRHPKSRSDASTKGPVSKKKEKSAGSERFRLSGVETGTSLPRRSSRAFFGILGLLLVVIIGAMSRSSLLDNFFDIPSLPAVENEEEVANFFNLGLSDILNRDGTANLLRSLGSLFKDRESREAVNRLAVSLIELKREIATLEKDLPLFVLGRPSGFRDSLERAQNILERADQDLGLIASSSGVEGALSLFGDYVLLQAELETWRDGIGSLLGIIDSGNPRHLIVFFGNSSELRPGWGFTGSFADIELGDGMVSNISVHGVNEVDRTLDTLIIPPEPLRVATSRFKVADSNWFFDYPTSASKTLSLMERSGMYADKSLVGAIAISPAVVKSLLSITGPIELSEGINLTSDDFLRQIQGEVQNARAAGSDSPKDILGLATISAIEKLADIHPEERSGILDTLLSDASEKDVMVFFRDPKLSRLVSRFGLDGAVYDTPVNFRGDYLAVVSANLASGKSDLVMEQDVILESRLEESGEVINHFEVTRRHNGEGEKAWWYRATNDSYLKIFTPKGSRLTFATGGEERRVVSDNSYENEYVFDPDIKAIEDKQEKSFDFPEIIKGREFGKATFSTWIKTFAGQEEKLTLDYSRRLSGALQPGDRYSFVLETQAGARSSFYIRIVAPVGYVWAENDLPAYEYRSDDPPGRVIINLTLREG